jgi:transposase
MRVFSTEHRIENVIAEAAELLRSIPGIGPVSVAMLLAEMPELGRMTATEAAAMTGLAPMSHDSGAMRGKRIISGGRRSLRHVLFQAGLAASCHNPVLKAVAKRMKQRGKSHKLVIIAIARRLVTIANAVLKTGLPWRISPVV